MTTPSEKQDPRNRLSIGENTHLNEEMRKLYSEILQLDNQRFLLTTAAVVLFSTVAGWVTTVMLRGGPVAVAQDLVTVIFLPLASTALLWWILLAIFDFQLSKAATIRWLAAYLLLQGSRWEWTWHTFRKEVVKNAPKENRNWSLFRQPGNTNGHSKYPFYQIHRMTAQTFATLIWAGFFYFLFLQSYIFLASAVLRLSGTRAFFLSPIPTVVLLLWIALAILIRKSVKRIRQNTEDVLRADEIAYMNTWAEAERSGAAHREQWKPPSGMKPSATAADPNPPTGLPPATSP